MGVAAPLTMSQGVEDPQLHVGDHPIRGISYRNPRVLSAHWRLRPLPVMMVPNMMYMSMHMTERQ